MQDITLTQKDILIYFAIVNLILGVLFGLFPVIVGTKTGNRKYGTIGFFASLVGGGLFGVFASFPLAFIFTWLSLRSAPPVAPPAVEASNEVDSPTEAH